MTSEQLAQIKVLIPTLIKVSPGSRTRASVVHLTITKTVGIKHSVQNLKIIKALIMEIPGVRKINVDNYTLYAGPKKPYTPKPSWWSRRWELPWYIKKVEAHEKKLREQLERRNYQPELSTRRAHNFKQPPGIGGRRGAYGRAGKQFSRVNAVSTPAYTQYIWPSEN